MDNQMLKKAAIEARLLELETIPTEQDLCNKFSFSEEFIEKMDILINKFAKKYIIFAGFVIQKTVAVACVVLILFTGCMGIPAVREPVISLFVKVYKTYSRITYSQANSVDEEFEYILPDVSEDYTLVSEEKLTLMYNVEFMYKDGSPIWYSQMNPKGATTTINTEGVQIEYEDINGHRVLKYYNKGDYTLMWTDKKYSYSLIGTSGFSVLEDILKTIK